MLALGVSAAHGSDLFIETTDRAAVTVLSPGIGLGELHPGELELFATTRSETRARDRGSTLCAPPCPHTGRTRGAGADLVRRLRHTPRGTRRSRCRPELAIARVRVGTGNTRRRRRSSTPAQHSRPSSVRSQRVNEVWLPPSALARPDRSGRHGDAPAVGSRRSSRSSMGYRPATCLSPPNAARSPLVGAWWSPISRATPALPAAGASALSVLCEKSNSRPDLGVAKRIRYESPALPHHP